MATGDAPQEPATEKNNGTSKDARQAEVFSKAAEALHEQNEVKTIFR